MSVSAWATGNFSEAARIKLEYYGIWQFFNGGGFGEQSLDRADVIRAAIENVANGAAPEDILIIGDTPKDIEAARDNGVVGVGVATGSYSADQLRESRRGHGVRRLLGLGEGGGYAFGAPLIICS